MPAKFKSKTKSNKPPIFLKTKFLIEVVRKRIKKFQKRKGPLFSLLPLLVLVIFTAVIATQVSNQRFELRKEAKVSSQYITERAWSPGEKYFNLWQLLKILARDRLSRLIPWLDRSVGKDLEDLTNRPSAVSAYKSGVILVEAKPGLISLPQISKTTPEAANKFSVDRVTIQSAAVLELNRRHQVTEIEPVFSFIADPQEVWARFPQRSRRVPEGILRKDASSLTNYYYFYFKEDQDAIEVAKEYLKLSRIKKAVPVYIPQLLREPNDPYYHSSGSWGQTDNGLPDGLPYDDLWGLKIIQAAAGWERSIGDKRIVVAVIDTGVDYTHPDFYSADGRETNIWINPGELPSSVVGSDGQVSLGDLIDAELADLDGNGKIDLADLLLDSKFVDGEDNDNNGRVDDLIGWDFAGDDNDPMDYHSHGTHCAGSVGARGNNGLGISGVNWEVKIMPVKVVSDGGGFTRTAPAILYAAENGADVLSNSWGAYVSVDNLDPMPADRQAIDDAKDIYGAIVFFAAGNGGNGTDTINPPCYPAGYDNNIAVAAANQSGGTSNFSSWSQYIDYIDIAAPGGNSADDTFNNGWQYLNVLSLRAQELDSYCDGFGRDYPSLCGDPSPNVVGERYYKMIGTSMACPHAAGLAGLVLAYNLQLGDRALSPDVVQHILEESADDIIQRDEARNHRDKNPDGTLKYTCPAEVGYDPCSGHGRINVWRALVSTEIAGGAYISSPTEGEVVSGLVAIHGSVRQPEGARLLSYKLEYGQGEKPSRWTEISRGSSPVSESVLATWDTNQILFNQYTLRLSASFSIENREVTFTYPVLVTVKNYELEITAPVGEEVIHGTIEVKGTAVSQTYQFHQVEYHLGGESGSWSSAGIQITTGPTTDNVLATWNTESIIYGDYTLKLTGTFRNSLTGDSESFEEEVEVTIRNLIRPQGTALPVTFPGAEVPSYPVLANLDGSPGLEVALAFKDGGDGDPALAVFDWRGDYLGSPTFWPREIPDYRSWVRSAPTVADLDGDGQSEVLVGTQQGKIYAFRSNGASYLNQNSDGLFAEPGGVLNVSPLVDDLDGNGQAEVIVVGTNGLVVYGHQGTLHFSKSDIGRVHDAPPASGDLDGDGKKEILVFNRSGRVYAFKEDGTGFLSPDGEFAESGEDLLGYGGISVGNLDNSADDSLEIVLLGYHKIFVWSAAGELLTDWPKEIVGTNKSSPALADLDGDGDLEIVVVTSVYTGPKLYVYHHDGSAVGGFDELDFSSRHYTPGYPIVTDVNGDASPDIALVVSKKGVYGGGGDILLYAFGNDGSVVAGYPIPFDYTGDQLDKAAPGLFFGNVKPDGKLNLVLVSSWSAPYPGQERAVTLDLLELPFVSNSRVAHWPTYYHDPRHTGNYHFQETGWSPPWCGEYDFSGDDLIDIDDFGWVKECFNDIEATGDPNPPSCQFPVPRRLGVERWVDVANSPEKREQFLDDLRTCFGKFSQFSQ